MATPNKERFAAYYQRKKQGIEIPKCKCDRPLKGNLSNKRQLCAACHETSLEGRHRRWLSMNSRRGRNVLLEYVPAWNEWKVGDEAIAPDGSVGIVQAIASYVNGDVAATVVFEDETQDIFLLSRENCLISH